MRERVFEILRAAYLFKTRALFCVANLSASIRAEARSFLGGLFIMLSLYGAGTNLNFLPR